MQEDTLNRLQVELHVPNLNQALEYYTVLGFKKVWFRSEGNGADYLVLERQGTILSFWPSVYKQSYFDQFPKDTKRGYGVEIVLPVDDVQKLHDEIKEFVKLVNPLIKRPWGLWDFRIEDPFGFYIRITERHNIIDTKYSVPTNYTET